MGRRAVVAAASFWSKVAILGRDECWIYPGSPSNRAGHKKFAYRRDGRQHNVGAHCFAFEQTKGPIPRGMVVRHTCDVPACVNPNHLVLGTYKDNTQDAVRKGRMARGERNAFAKLTVEEVRRIRSAHAGGESQVSIARRLGITQAGVSAVVLWKLWKHVA